MYREGELVSVLVLVANPSTTQVSLVPKLDLQKADVEALAEMSPYSTRRLHSRRSVRARLRDQAGVQNARRVGSIWFQRYSLYCYPDFLQFE